MLVLDCPAGTLSEPHVKSVRRKGHNGNELRRNTVHHMAPQNPSENSTCSNSPNLPSPNPRPCNSRPKPHALWDIARPLEVTEAERLEIGEVSNFIDDKGYGFLDTADGRLFFHACGFRVPRPVNVKRNGVSYLEIQLARVRPKEHRETDGTQPRQKSTHIPIPVITAKMGIMFVAGLRSDKRQAVMWCLQDMYQSLLRQHQTRYEQELLNWQQLGRYKLELCERRNLGTFRANNNSKTFIPESNVLRTELFNGTNVEYLKNWYVDCCQQYRVSSGNFGGQDTAAERWMELSFQIYDDKVQQFGDWQQCDQVTMNDFLTSQ